MQAPWFAATLDEVLMLQPITNQAGNRNHLHAVTRTEIGKLRNASHGAVGIHDFADHAARLETGHARQIDRGFGLSRPYEHAAFSSAQRKYVARPGQIA